MEIVLRKRKHRLADLIAQCDLKAPPPVDLASWESTKTAGREIW